MLTEADDRDPDVTRTFLVQCDECQLERTVEGREEAARTANDHQIATQHDVLALELPASKTS